MKICWDNLNELRYNKKTQRWYKDRYKNGKVVGTNPYTLRGKCIVCDEDFLSAIGNKGKCCSLPCNARYRNSIIPMKEETKKKISQTKVGYKRSEESRRKQGKTVKKLGRWRGEKNPVNDPILKEKRRKTIVESGIFKGENNPNWKGGNRDIHGYPWYFNTELKEKIRSRDNNTCQNPMCKGISENIEVHHIDYNKDNCEDFNLITLCKSCNMSANQNKEWHKEWYKLVMSKRSLS